MWRIRSISLRMIFTIVPISTAMSYVERVMANDKCVDFEEYVESLRNSTSATLMIIPRHIAFRYRVDEARLPTVSCVYQIEIGSKAFNSLIETIKDELTEHEHGPLKLSEVRIGILFEGSGAMKALYFEDSRDNREIKGSKDGYKLSASPDFPEKLRALALSPGATLSHGRHNCPHS
jgi:hypothetical protein